MSQNDDISDAHVSQEVPETTAMRVFENPAASGDFPVLKAFQEYLEAEQAKARKRMLGLSVFFVVLLVVVVVTFTLIMSTVINRNQALSDRLLDIALRDRAPQQAPVAAPPVVNVQPAPQPHPANDAAIKALTDKIEALSKVVSQHQQPVVQQPAPTPVIVAAPATPAPTIVVDDQARAKAQLEQQRKALEAEREKIKAEREKMHQEQVEAHRRRLYPEYYAREDAKKKGVPLPDPAQIQAQAEAKKKAEAERKAAEEAKREMEQVKKELDQLQKKIDEQKLADAKRAKEEAKRAEELKREREAEAKRKRDAAARRAQVNRLLAEEPAAKGKGGYFAMDDAELDELLKKSPSIPPTNIRQMVQQQQQPSAPLPKPAAAKPQTPPPPSPANKNEPAKRKPETISIGTSSNAIPMFVEIPEVK